MKTIQPVIFLAVALASSGLSHAGENRPARAAVEHAIAVKHVTGIAEYAYDSTGWKPLQPGKVLHAGAHVRTRGDSSVVLAMEEQGSFVRVGPSSKLELAKAAPSIESRITIVPLQVRTRTLSGPEFAFEK